MAVGILALGAFFLIGARAVTILPSYAFIGPRFFPYLVGSGLLVCGLLLAINPFVAHRPRLSSPEFDREDWAAVGWIVGGLILSVALMQRAGYIVTMTLLFAFAARGLGSSRPLISVAAGLTLSAATYLAFTRLLDLRLPAGWLQFIAG